MGRCRGAFHLMDRALVTRRRKRRSRRAADRQYGVELGCAPSAWPPVAAAGSREILNLPSIVARLPESCGIHDVGNAEIAQVLARKRALHMVKLRSFSSPETTVIFPAFSWIRSPRKPFP